MPQVQILSRYLALGTPGIVPSVRQVVVTYSSPTVPPRSILLPAESYRTATNDELVANPRLPFYPKDQPAQDAELQAIGDDIRKAQQGAPPTFEVP